MSFWELFDRLDMMVAWPLALRICRTLSYLMYLIHVKACVYYVFSTVRGLASTSFVFQGKTDAYIRCFYFAMKTAAKIGKNPKPVDIVEETFMIFNWLIGVLACAAIIGQVNSFISSFSSFFLHFDVPKPLHGTWLEGMESLAGNRFIDNLSRDLENTLITLGS